MTRETVITNARIWTGRGETSDLGSILVRGGRIDSIGPQVSSSASANVIDAGGLTIAPGFVDAHMHLIMGGLALNDLDLRDVRSRAEFEERIEQAHKQLPSGHWLVARNWSSEGWSRGGSNSPEKSWLRVAGDRPVVCYRMDLHAAVVNGAVLEMCDLSTDPLGGRIVRDSDGEPTGLMLEAALWKLVNPLVPEPDVEAKTQALLSAQAHCHALGITSVGTMEYAREVRDVLLPMADRLTLRCAVTLLDRGWPMDFSEAKALASAARGALTVIGCKAFADGTLGSRTARLFDDYADDPGNRGMFVEIAAEGRLRDWAQAVADAGFSPAIHAIGDEAVRAALDAMAELPEEVVKRVEHAQQIDERDGARFSHIIPSMQPLHKADDGRYALARLGAQRMRGFFPFRQLLDCGASLAFGSDWPVVSCDPIAGMRAAITGLNLNGDLIRPEENITSEEAMTAYTRDSAKALQLRDVGVLAEGMAADLVMFGIDPLTADWIKRPPQVVMTMVRGEIVFDDRRATALAGV